MGAPQDGYLRSDADKPLPSPPSKDGMLRTDGTRGVRLPLVVNNYQFLRVGDGMSTSEKIR